MLIVLLLAILADVYGISRLAEWSRLLGLTVIASSRPSCSSS